MNAAMAEQDDSNRGEQQVIIIRNNLPQLVDTMDCCAMFPYIRLKRMFSRRTVAEWEEDDRHGERKKVNISLLGSVSRRVREFGVKAFNDFVEILWITGQKDSAKMLKPEVPEGIMCTCAVDASAARLTNSAVFRPRIDQQKYYNMTAKPRGFCIIINNKNFEHEEDVRHQSELDARNLEEAFKYLGFVVHLFHDLTAKEMLDVVRGFTLKSEDLEKHDAIAVVIMTHGNDKVLKGVDNALVSEHEITILFNAINCPEMKDKPKLFFIQACRGDKDDEGVLRDFDDTDDEEFPVEEPRPQRQTNTSVCDAQPFSTPCRRASCYDPSHGDMLISYATVPGYRAYRTVAAADSSHLGSWYVKALHFRLVEGAHEKEIKDILNEVYKDVKDMETEEGFKQATTYENRGFHKELYFNPGYYV